MPIIIIITIIIYLIAISWTWQNLGAIENKKKIGFLIVGFIILFIITLVVFSISKTTINYPSSEIETAVKNMLVAVFTGLNALIAMPYIGSLMGKVNENEIEQKEFSKRMIIIGIIFVICIFFECGYLRDIQEGILGIYQSAA